MHLSQNDANLFILRQTYRFFLGGSLIRFFTKMQLFIVPPANEKQVSNNCVWRSETDEQFADGFLQVSNSV